MQESQYKAFTISNSFLATVIHFIEKSLSEIKDAATESTGQLMDSSIEMGKVSSKRKAEAEKMMAETHLNPDENLSKEIESHQQDVDAIMDAAMGDSASSSELSPDEVARAQSRREGGKFSKNVEAISKYEEKLTEILVKMAGSLSNEDVMKQLLENVVIGQVDLIAFLQIFPDTSANSPKGSEIITHMNKILADTKKRCRSTEEKKALNSAYNGFEEKLQTDVGVTSLGQISNIIDYTLRYSAFLKTLIGILKTGYSDIIENATTGIYAINDSATEMKEHANSVMRQGERGEFKNQSMSDFEKEEESMFGEQKESTPINSEIFTLPKGMLANMDDDVGNQLMTMMGCLSIGDVIGQRIGNLNTACDALHRILLFLQKNMEEKLEPEKMKKINSDCAAYIKKSFVTEEERLLFTRILEERSAA